MGLASAAQLILIISIGPCICFLLPSRILIAGDQNKAGIYSYAVSIPLPRIRIPLSGFENIKQRFSTMEAPSIPKIDLDGSQAIAQEFRPRMFSDASSRSNVEEKYGALTNDGVLSSVDLEAVSSVSTAEVVPKSCFAGRVLAFFLKRLIEPRTKSVSGLVVNVLSSSNRDIVRGRVEALEIKFDSIAYSMIQITGGGTLSVYGVELKMRRLLFQDLHFLRKPYSISAEFVFKESDIVNSRIIRDLIQLLVDTVINRVLSDPARGIVPKVHIRRVTIRSRRIYVNGEADVGTTGAAIPFEISTGAGVRDKQIVFLRDIQVVLNPDSFLRTSVPLLLSTPIDVDIGDDCELEDLIFSPDDITVRARSVVYPVEPFAVSPVVSRALYRYDLTTLLSSLLRFKGGFLRVRLYIPPVPTLGSKFLLSCLTRFSRRLRDRKRQEVGAEVA